MTGQTFVTERDWEAEITRSEDYKLPERTRSGIRHDLIDEAMRLHNNEFWLKVGRVLIRAALDGDLTPQVSDHFVDHAPDHVFKTIVCENTRQPPFKAWRKRGTQLLGSKYLAYDQRK